MSSTSGSWSSTYYWRLFSLAWIGYPFMVAFAPRSFDEFFCFASFDEIRFVIGKNARLPQRKWKCQWQWRGLHVLRTPKLKLPYNPRFLYDESRPAIPRKIREKSSCDSIIWPILDQKQNCCPFLDKYNNKYYCLFY